MFLGTALNGSAASLANGTTNTPSKANGVGEIAALIEALGIGAVTFRQIAWREARVAVLDP